MIKTIATVYQKQRRIDDMGRVIAEIQDYALAFQLIEESFRKTLTEYNNRTDKKMKLIEKEGPITPRALVMKTGVSSAAISQWSKQLVKRGGLCWCDKKGMEFSDDQALDKAKRSGKAYVRVSRPNSLPTPYQLTKDRRWDVDGEYYQIYDLELECDDGDNVENNGNSGRGVKVLSTMTHDEYKKLRRESAKRQEQEPRDPVETDKLYEEFGDILRVDKGVNKFTQDLDEYFEQDESGEVDIPIDTRAALSECMLAFVPC